MEGLDKLNQLRPKSLPLQSVKTSRFRVDTA
jgi:hypothetical protein